MNALPSLRQLQYLVALHDQRHFGRAAAACFATQSTVSLGIADLERVLGATLVERTRRTLRFTPLGEEAVARARRILAEAEGLVDAARAAGQPMAGPIRLAVIPTVAPFLLPRILPAIGAAFPQLRLRVRELLTVAGCEALARGSVDCVLLALPFACGDTEVEEIAVDRLLLAGRDAAAADVPIAADDIATERLLLLEDGHCLKDHALAACERPGGDAMLVASNLHTLVQMVDAGLGETLLPEMARAAGILAGTGIACRPVTGAAAERRIALVWRRGSARAADFRALAATIREAVQSRNLARQSVAASSMDTTDAPIQNSITPPKS